MINAMQMIVDWLGAEMKDKRAESQLTLGKLITVLEQCGPGHSVYGLGEIMSYRGYYSDIAFKPADRTESVESLLKRCKNVMGRELEGYKGGLFMMGETTPLWISEYGETSRKKIVHLKRTYSDPLVLEAVTEDEDD